MRIIGITGGIGSGKSTVARILAHLGAKIVDADVIARQVVAKGQKALTELVEYFGADIISDEGELDRKKLAAIVFKDRQKLEFLNKTTHKYIMERIKQTVECYKNAGDVDLVVLDVPIPTEEGFLDTADSIWVVTANVEVRIDRIMKRSGLTREEAIDRINAQYREDDYKKIADEVICNNEGLEQLEQAIVKKLYSNNP